MPTLQKLLSKLSQRMCLARLIMLKTQNQPVKSVQARSIENSESFILTSHSSVQLLQEYQLYFVFYRRNITSCLSASLFWHTEMSLNSWHALETGSGALVSPLKGTAELHVKGADNAPTKVLHPLPPSLLFLPTLVKSDLLFYEGGSFKQDWILLHHRVAQSPPVK